MPREKKVLTRVLAVGCLVAAGLGMPATAIAETTNDTVTRWGLLGTWTTVDCNKPAKESQRLIYVIRQGKAVHLRDFGDRKDEAEILRALVAPDGSLELRIRYPSINQTRDLAFMRGPDQRIKVKFNRNAEGDWSYSIFDAKFVANGSPAPWQTRCDAR